MNLHNKRAAGAQAIAGRRSAVIASLPSHLRMLAVYTERLSVSRDPERFAASKGEIVRTLENLAVVIEIERREQAPKSQIVRKHDLGDGLQP